MTKHKGISFHILNSFRAKASHIFVLFATMSLFLIVYNPFNLMDEAGTSLLSTIYFSVIIAFVFSLIATITLFLYKHKFNENRYMLHDYIFMVIINIIITSLVFSIGSTIFFEYIESFILVFTIALIPYLLTTSFSLIRHLIEELIEKKALLAIAKSDPNNVEMLKLYDEYGKASFYLDKNSILYIEANDNYVNIYYYANSRVSYKILRASMKSIEALLSKHSIIRCHRSYMVNVQKINSIKKERGKLKLSLNKGDFLVPVSPTFTTTIEKVVFDSPLNNR